jgi:hypothetical protein
LTGRERTGWNKGVSSYRQDKAQAGNTHLQLLLESVQLQFRGVGDDLGFWDAPSFEISGNLAAMLTHRLGSAAPCLQLT